MWDNPQRGTAYHSEKWDTLTVHGQTLAMPPSISYGTGLKFFQRIPYRKGQYDTLSLVPFSVVTMVPFCSAIHTSGNTLAQRLFTGYL